MRSSNYHPPRRRDSEFRSLQHERREIQFSPEELSLREEKMQARAEARRKFKQSYNDNSEYHQSERTVRGFDRDYDESTDGFYNYEENREHLRYASPDFNTGYSHDATRPLPRDFVSSSNYEQEKRLRQEHDYSAEADSRGVRRHDKAIEADISHILSQHRGIDGRDIDVAVSDGIVTLTGFVPERKMRYLAEDISVNCFGVIDVTNHIRVKRTSDVGVRFGGRRTFGRQA
ncbi:BON domain-containing protein [Bdellovibrio sp. HCB209]|uniref:BON domain-containing protein n=1 Tax=Bdellovibrio sp. HCB209 TaxID=3394354 RepID=UPI0039B4D299